jgi:hypothetical protein
MHLASGIWHLALPRLGEAIGCLRSDLFIHSQNDGNGGSFENLLAKALADRLMCNRRLRTEKYGLWKSSLSHFPLTQFVSSKWRSA